MLGISIGASEAALIFSRVDDSSVGPENRSQTRRRRALVTRRLVPLAGSVPVTVASGSQSCWRRRLMMICITSYEDYLCSIRLLFLMSWVVASHQFSSDPAVIPNYATWHQLVTLWQSICAEKKAKISEPLMSGKSCPRIIDVCSLTCVHRMLDGLQEWMKFWAVLNAWNRVHHVLCSRWLKPPTLAATRQRVVSRAEVSIPSGLAKWRKSEGGLSRPFLCDWGNGRSRQSQSFLLSHLQVVSVDLWVSRTPATFSKLEILPHIETSLSWNPRVAVPWIWGSPEDRGGGRAAAVASFEGSTGGRGQRVPICRKPPCGQFWCSWRQSPCSCQDVGVGRSTAFGRTLQKCPPAVVPVHSRH